MNENGGVTWDALDYAAAIFLIGAATTAVLIVWRRVKKNTYRIISALIILMVLALVWAQLAVGIV